MKHNPEQQALFPYNHHGRLPMTRLRQSNTESLRRDISLPFFAGLFCTWQVQVGRVNPYTGGHQGHVERSGPF